MKKYFLIVVLIILTQIAFAQTPNIYRGTLGTQEIEVSLIIKGNTAFGSYNYTANPEQNGGYMQIKGSWNNDNEDNFEFQEINTRTKRVTGTWRGVALEENRILKINWISADQKTSIEFTLVQEN